MALPVEPLCRTIPSPQLPLMTLRCPAVAPPMVLEPELFWSWIPLPQLATELVPAARGTMMALNVAAMALGRALGAPLGTALWAAGGLLWNGLVASAGTLLALVLLLALVREG
ncbi:MAG: hypothetical protein QHJ81_16120, partial [Anaerolineae bacterium]|nr:hypothetical protein [Anaerolineae bacterium]